RGGDARAQGLPARVAGEGRPHHALPARQQRSRQQPCRPRDHERAVRRRPRAAPDSGDPPRDARRGSDAPALAPRPPAPPVRGRPRCFMEDTGKPCDVALAVTRAGNLFTTHTPVAAGFDRFDPALITRTLGGYARKGLGISVEELLALGRERPADQSEPFNMAHLAIRGSLAVNGVSRLHGAVSRSLFQSLFPRLPAAEVPIGHVTNGVHVPTWDSEAADSLWTRVCGKDRWTGTQEGLEARCLSVSDADL